MERVGWERVNGQERTEQREDMHGSVIYYTNVRLLLLKKPVSKEEINSFYSKKPTNIQLKNLRLINA